MAIDGWLSKLKSQEKAQSEAFFALEIAQETVKSAVWSVENKETQVLKVGAVEERKEGDKESFLRAVDATISSSGEGIIPEPKGILFGLPEDWVEKQIIILERKKWLKELCEKLDLKPLGFVVTTEALVQYFKAQQGTPLNAILIRINDSDLLVSLVLAGKIKLGEIVGRTEDLVADVREGLARFSVENLPPRMILYNGMVDFEEAKQELLSFDWQKELPFLHFPKIETLSREISIRAVSIAGGSEVARSLGLEVIETVEPDGKEKEKEIEEETFEPVKETLPKEPLAASPADPADLGFVKGRDILEGRTEVGEEAEAKTEKKLECGKIEAEEGILGETEKKEPELKPETISSQAGFFSVIGKKILGIFQFFKGFFPDRGFYLPFKGYKSIALLSGIVLIALIAGGFAFYWYVPGAEVTIFVTPKVLEKELTIRVSTETEEIDVERAVIPGRERELEIDGSLSAPTTGTKLVGEKARGRVTVLNKTESKKTFKAGAVLIGSENLRFELTEDVAVASRSAEELGITYGKAEVEAEAADLGPEYNLGGGSELSFKGLSSSDYSAKADNGFSGGSSREIQAVSQEDQDSLLKKLTDQLRGESKQTLEAGLEDEEVFEDGIAAEVLEENFDKKAGEEADNLNLTLRLKLTALSFSRNQLNQLLLYLLSESLPEDFQLKTEDIETEVDEVEVEKGQVRIKLVARAKLLPKYDVASLRDNLVGKYPPLVQDYLATLPNFAKADIKISPKLPGKLNTLPRVKGKIKIKLEAME